MYACTVSQCSLTKIKVAIRICTSKFSFHSEAVVIPSALLRWQNTAAKSMNSYRSQIPRNQTRPHGAGLIYKAADFTQSTLYQARWVLGPPSWFCVKQGPSLTPTTYEAQIRDKGTAWRPKERWFFPKKKSKHIWWACNSWEYILNYLCVCNLFYAFNLGERWVLTWTIVNWP